MYDPSIGRWLSEDPIGHEAADPNLYRYVGNSPITAVDPTGLLSQTLVSDDSVTLGPNGEFRVKTQFVLNEGEDDGIIIQRVWYINFGIMREDGTPQIKYKEFSDSFNKVVGNIKNGYFEMWRVKDNHIFSGIDASLIANNFDLTKDNDYHPDINDLLGDSPYGDITNETHDNFAWLGTVGETCGQLIQKGHAMFFPDEAIKPYIGRITGKFHSGGAGIANAGSLFSANYSGELMNLIRSITYANEPRPGNVSGTLLDGISQSFKQVERVWGSDDFMKERRLTTNDPGWIKVSIDGKNVAGIVDDELEVP